MTVKEMVAAFAGLSDAEVRQVGAMVGTAKELLASEDPQLVRAAVGAAAQSEPERLLQLHEFLLLRKRGGP